MRKAKVSCLISMGYGYQDELVERIVSEDDNPHMSLEDSCNLAIQNAAWDMNREQYHIRWETYAYTPIKDDIVV